jgi:hypothetical protein
MNSREVEVLDADGNTTRATLIVCPECGGLHFAIFVVGAAHQHLQCSECGTSFCDGACGNEKDPPT